MKDFTILVFALSASLTFGQNSVELIPTLPEAPANAVWFSTKPVVSAYATGHWVAVDKGNKLAGFAVSEISCDKAGTYIPKSRCHETGATVIQNVGFQVLPEDNEYDVISWRADGLTARSIGGLCQIAHTLEIDFHTGSVLITDSPTKTKAGMSCPTESHSYQLMEGESFSVVENTAKGKTGK